MFLGRVQQGDWLRIPVWTADASGFKAWPTDGSANTVFPYLWIIDPTKTHQMLILSEQPLTAVDRFDSTQTGYHALQQRIGPELPVGVYYCYLQWQAASASYNRRQIHVFQVVAGGNTKGAYTSITFYEKPQASWIVGQTDGGLLEARRNPK